MIAYNICFTTLLKKQDFDAYTEDQVFTIVVPRPDKKAKDGAEYDFSQRELPDEVLIDDADVEEDDDEIVEEKKNLINSLADVVSDEDNFYFRFVKPEI